MKYFFKSPEIYVKLTRSTQYPTVKDTPIVPIRGLWVAGIHRSIFNIDHCVTITGIESSHAGVHDYTSSNEVIRDEGCSILGIVRLKSSKLNAQKYTTSQNRICDEGCSVLGIVCCGSKKVVASKYSTTNENVEDEGCSILGIVSANNTVIPHQYSNTEYKNICDSHGIFVSNVTSHKATITDINASE